MIFGKWTPAGAFVACLIFGLGEAILREQLDHPHLAYLLSMLPYILTLIVLAGIVDAAFPRPQTAFHTCLGSE